MGAVQSMLLGLILSDGPGDVYAIQKKDGVADQLSPRFGWSTHNCSCNRSKTGLVLYPSDIRFKNVVLLVCERWYQFRQGQGTQHQQLLNWYYRLYGSSKDYRRVSGFCKKQDGHLEFIARSMNLVGPYATGNIACLEFEQSRIRKVVNGKLNNYQV